jgi:L-proline 4-hydroxylase
MQAKAEKPLVDLKSSYERDGWIEYPYRLSGSTLELLRERIESISLLVRPEVVYEQGTKTVRAILGCHAFGDACSALVRHPQLLALAEALLGRSVYVYQFKVNIKQAHEGAAWSWHQDFTFWSEKDGMPRPDAVNIAFPLDGTYEGNGPLVLIPGSHRLGIHNLPKMESGGRKSDWRQHISANLAYTVKSDHAESLSRMNGKKSLISQSGSIYAFHPSIVHSSSNNLSADRRALLIITYNAIDNAPSAPPARRSWRTGTPLRSVRKKMSASASEPVRAS